MLVVSILQLKVLPLKLGQIGSPNKKNEGFLWSIVENGKYPEVKTCGSINYGQMVLLYVRICVDPLGWTHNPGHNILALFNNLADILIPTSKTILDIQYSKRGIRVASRVAKRLKTQDLRKLGNIRKMSNLGGDAAQCPVFLLEIKL